MPIDSGGGGEGDSIEDVDAVPLGGVVSGKSRLSPSKSKSSPSKRQKHQETLLQAAAATASAIASPGPGATGGGQQTTNELPTDLSGSTDSDAETTKIVGRFWCFLFLYQ